MKRRSRHPNPAPLGAWRPVLSAIQLTGGRITSLHAESALHWLLGRPALRRIAPAQLWSNSGMFAVRLDDYIAAQKVASPGTDEWLDRCRGRRVARRTVAADTESPLLLPDMKPKPEPSSNPQPIGPGWTGLRPEPIQA